jgi:2-C-methyl-D-erythritol 2,4-cyclodiphosphate synthase
MTPGPGGVGDAGGAGDGLRVGQGIDVHRFSDDPERPLVLGGVVVTGDGARGLDGHSDADAVCHAIADAVLGAAGLGDLGRHAPDDDPRWEGVDSLDLLAQMVGLARSAGWVPVNADCTVVAERPRLAPFVAAMAERLSGVLGGPVNVKATRAEGLGALGRAEGIACTAVVLLAGAGGTPAVPAPGARHHGGEGA